MKKTLTVNLNGKVFNIDEDAYELLENYLSNLKSYFGKKPDAAEILSDFEARIEELLSEKIKSGYEVITIEEVEAVIMRMGNPEDLGDETIGTEKENVASDNPKENKSKKKFYRNIDDKKLGGVCSGIAAYFGLDPLPIRLVFVVLALLSTGWLFLFYLILWILMPEARTASQKLEMKGEAVTLENIGKTVSETIASVKTSEIESFLSAMLKVCAIVFSCIIGLPLLIVFFALVVALIATIFGVGSLFFMPLDFLGFDNGPYPVIGIVALIVIIGIPLFSIIYSIFIRDGKSSSFFIKMKLFIFLIWIIAFATFIFSGAQFAKQHNWNVSWNGPWNIHYNLRAIKGNGNLVTSEKSVSIFEKINADNSAAVRFHASQEYRVVITVDENLEEYLEIDTKGDVLNIGTKAGSYSFTKFQVDVYCPVLTNVAVSGSGSFVSMDKITTSTFESAVSGFGKIEGSIECEKFSAKISGSGKIKGNIECENFFANISGLGEITVVGNSKDANINISGSGRFTGSEFTTNNANIHISGLGNVDIYVTDNLNANISGSGSINYRGEPKLETNVSGLGRIRKM
jgi:phage shock protein PspC (stress-responsive transcriptional regulator)